MRNIGIVVLMIASHCLASDGTVNEGAGTIEQFNITWTFDKQLTTDGAGDTYQYGTFVNGEYWVLDEGGGVVVSSVSPPRAQVDISGLYWMHGSQVNPTTAEQPFNEIHPNTYNGSLIATYPLTLDAGDSLMSSIGWETAGTNNDIINYGAARGVNKTIAVLTTLGSVPSDNCFRPPYFGTEKPLFDADDLNLDLLPKLTVPAAIVSSDFGETGGSAYDVYQYRDDSTGTVADQYARVFKRPWIVHQFDTHSWYNHPTESMPSYHREVGRTMGCMAVLLCCDLDAVDGAGELYKIVIPFVQLGIDINYVAKNVHGGSSKVRWPTIFAGIMLENAALRDAPADWVKAAIDRVGTQLYTVDDITSTIESAVIPAGEFYHDYTVGWRQGASDQSEYEHLDPTADVALDPPDFNARESYRQINSPAYIGYGFATYFMDATDYWGTTQIEYYAWRYRGEEESSSVSGFVNEMYDAFYDWVPEEGEEPEEPAESKIRRNRREGGYGEGDRARYR